MSEKTPPERLTLESPSKERKRTVVFSKPLFPPAPGEQALYARLAVRDENNELIFGSDLTQEGEHAYFPPLEDESLWSPDGRFLLVVAVANVESPQDTGPQSYRFLDTARGEWASFRADGTIAGTDNFFGWVPGKRHTMRVRHTYGRMLEAEPTIEDV